MSQKTRLYGVKFPFTAKNIFGTYTDLNLSPLQSVKSQLIHLISTPKGQRLRRPNFGTRLIQFIFNPNDNQSLGEIEAEIRETVKTNIPNCEILDIQTLSDGGNSIRVLIRFTAKVNGEDVEDVIALDI